MVEDFDFTGDAKEFPNGPLNIILVKLKPFLVNGLSKILKLIPDKYVVNSYEKCDCSELQRQWEAFEFAMERWDCGSNKDSRTNKSLMVMRDVYFTIMQREANYQKLSALFLDEYRRVKNGEKGRIKD